MLLVKHLVSYFYIEQIVKQTFSGMHKVLNAHLYNKIHVFLVLNAQLKFCAYRCGYIYQNCVLSGQRKMNFCMYFIYSGIQNVSLRASTLLML